MRLVRSGFEMRRIWRWVVLVILAVVISAVIWFLIPLGPLDGADDSLISGENVLVDDDPWLTFTPIDQAATGLILYPGARVNPVSYAPAARAIAEEGYLTVVVPMPFNMAVLSPNRAEEVIAAHPEIETWAIGGHSLGGAMAAQFANTHRTVTKGVILWAAYPGVNTSLRNGGQAVQVVYGTSDCISTPEEVLATKVRLPADAEIVAIEGGNHLQFGWYEGQAGSCAPSISLADQQAIVVESAVEFLDDLDR
ncbi:MAG: alpha/beta hydrolase [Acidimicrobiia bacterium]|nr:alpha/beta hydrolase [Acidimicrobiia bacterium]